MKTHKHKILVLSDLRNSADIILKSTINLANIVDGKIHFFYVKQPKDVVKSESQLSAMRTFKDQYVETKKKMDDLILPITKKEGVNIKHSFSFGNVKTEIEKQIETIKPDIIVLGKRRGSALKLVGDNITNFVLSKYNGTVVIVDKDNAIEPNKELGLGLLNNNQEPLSIPFVNHLLSQTQKPLKSFKIVSNTKGLQEHKPSTEVKTVEYVFEQDSNTIKNLSNYLLKNNINLLCLDRDKTDGENNLVKSNIKEVINKLNVSILLPERQKATL